MEQLPVLTPVTLLFFSLITIIVGHFKRDFAFPLAAAGTAMACLTSCLGLARVLSDGPQHYYLGNWAPPIGIEYVMDHLAAFMSALIMVVALITIIYSRRSFLREIPDKIAPAYTVVLLLLCGLTGIVVTGDLFNLYVFLEIASLSGYALVAIGSQRAPVAAFRYIIMGTLGACFYLLGVGFVYFATGSLNMADVMSILPHIWSSKLILAAAVFILTGIGLKMAIFPLHTWLPDAYTYAPSAVTALIGPLMTKVGAYVIIRMFLSVFSVSYLSETIPAAAVLGWLGAAGVLFGSIMAIAQKDMQRMLAYSSVAQIGFIALGIGLANPLGMLGAMLHILNHAFMKACLFGVSGDIRYSGHTLAISEFRGLGKALPLPAAAFTVATLSMVGIPPTAGFFSKWYLVLGCIESGNWVFAAVILGSSLLTAVYFFRVLENMYIKPVLAARKASAYEKVPGEMAIPGLILACGIIVLGLINVLIVNNVLQPALALGF